MTGCIWRIVIMAAILTAIAGFCYGYVWAVFHWTGPVVDWLLTIPAIKSASDHVFTALGGFVVFVVFVLSQLGVIKTGSNATR